MWHPDARFFKLVGADGAPRAYFYMDPYSRPAEKRGGAWMAEVAGRSRLMAAGAGEGAEGGVRLPVAHVVCNQMVPVGGKPSLMTFRDVETLFHGAAFVAVCFVVMMMMLMCVRLVPGDVLRPFGGREEGPVGHSAAGACCRQSRPTDQHHHDDNNTTPLHRPHHARSKRPPAEFGHGEQGGWMGRSLQGACVCFVFIREDGRAAPPLGSAADADVTTLCCNHHININHINTVTACQHMLTSVEEGMVAGIRGVEWDAVELPSQFM